MVVGLLSRTQSSNTRAPHQTSTLLLHSVFVSSRFNSSKNPTRQPANWTRIWHSISQKRTKEANQTHHKHSRSSKFPLLPFQFNTQNPLPHNPLHHDQPTWHSNQNPSNLKLINVDGIGVVCVDRLEPQSQRLRVLFSSLLVRHLATPQTPQPSTLAIRTPPETPQAEVVVNLARFWLSSEIDKNGLRVL